MSKREDNFLLVPLQKVGGDDEVRKLLNLPDHKGKTSKLERQALENAEKRV